MSRFGFTLFFNKHKNYKHNEAEIHFKNKHIQAYAQPAKYP